jgi:RNA polymerase sigma-54 factor
MSQTSRHIQEQTLEQRQGISQFQFQLTRLLELPIEGLEERVRTEVMENPALEESDEGEMPVLETSEFGYETDDAADENMADEEEVDETPESYTTDVDEQYLETLGDYRTLDDIPDYALTDRNSPEEVKAIEIPFAASTSFYEQLKEQLAETTLDMRGREIAEYLIGSLDDDGLLRKQVESIVEELVLYHGIDTTQDEVMDVLHHIQRFDPAGVGAQSLRECLLIQLKRKKQGINTSDAIYILEHYYDDFSNKRWERIRERMKISEENLAQAIEELTGLNPRPGSSLSESVGRGQQGIIPDVIVRVDDNENVVFNLNNSHIPDLKVSATYQRMMKECQSEKETRQTREAVLFLKQKIDAAQAFIDMLTQRETTIMAVMQAIVTMQRDFFLEGDECLLKPMLMKDVAEATGLDISTVSRVSSSKYVETNHGIFPVKFFFGDVYHKPVPQKEVTESREGMGSTSDEEPMTQRKIRVIIRQFIEEEDKNAPLTDEEMTAMLKEQGYDLARRTVAKYRQQMGIPVARMRR